MEHDVVLTCADGSVRIFRIYGRAAPCVGGVFTLPIDDVNAAEMEMA